jgi:preprotein translocase subunit SecE
MPAVKVAAATGAATSVEIASKKVVAKPARTDPRAKPRPMLFASQLGGVSRSFANTRRGLDRFVWEIRSELRKVVWPSRKEATNLTLIVVAVSAAVGVFLGGIDYIFRKIFELLVRV